MALLAARRTSRTVFLRALPSLVIALCLFWSASALAETSIAILDFELYDLTPLPDTPEELARTASLRPLLEEALQAKGGYRLVTINADAVRQANPGFGYLFDHPEAAAALGRESDADWILVGRLHKPSFLFAYLLTHLIDTRTGRVAAEEALEIKGPAPEVTRRGISRLAERIGQTLGTAGTATTP